MHAFGRPIHAGFALLAVATIFTASCVHPAARVNAPLAPARLGSTETGVASWYGFPYNGRRAASGEVYDMEQLTAAHRTLPFQTWIEVTNLSNGKQVEVRINDRGPFAKGRILDLSQAAARDIDMLRAGTARVRLKVIPAPQIEPPAPVTVAAAPVTASTDSSSLGGGGYAVQAGAFSEHERAESLRATLEDRFPEVRVLSNGHVPPLWRVMIGRDLTREQAAELAARVRQATGAALLVLEPMPEPEPLSK